MNVLPAPDQFEEAGRFVSTVYYLHNISALPRVDTKFVLHEPPFIHDERPAPPFAFPAMRWSAETHFLFCSAASRFGRRFESLEETAKAIELGMQELRSVPQSSWREYFEGGQRRAQFQENLLVLSSWWGKVHVSPGPQGLLLNGCSFAYDRDPQGKGFTEEEASRETRKMLGEMLEVVQVHFPDAPSLEVGFHPYHINGEPQALRFMRLAGLEMSADDQEANRIHIPLNRSIQSPALTWLLQGGNKDKADKIVDISTYRPHQINAAARRADSPAPAVAA